MKVLKLDPANSYQRQIFDYIRNYHPQLFLDIEELQDIIIMRANKAHDAFRQAFREGLSPNEASYEANQALHSGLEFAPCSYIKEFYEELYKEELNDHQSVEIWLKTKDIFPKYGMDVEGTDAEERLRKELEPFMTQLL